MALTKNGIAFIILIGLVVLLGISIYASTRTNKTTVYYFSAQGCPHCKAFDPIWDEVAKHTKTKMIKVDANSPNSADLAMKYGVTTAPTVVLVSPTKTIRFTGDRTVENLRNFIDSNS